MACTDRVVVVTGAASGIGRAGATSRGSVLEVARLSRGVRGSSKAIWPFFAWACLSRYGQPGSTS
jgi:hypothetical protein